MPLQSDITINAVKYDPANIPEGAAKFNAGLAEFIYGKPQWWEVGVAKYRDVERRRREEKNPPLESGINITIPSRDEGRDMTARMFRPAQGGSKGVLLHFHLGGWVLFDEHSQDGILKWMADDLHLTVISLGYRLAPEHPYPAAVNDCVDAAEYLLANGSKYGGELLFISGESCGGHLTMLTILHLLRTHSEPLPIKGIMPLCGLYDASQFFPAPHDYHEPQLIWYDAMVHFVNAFLPNTTIEQLRDPLISPFYENLDKFRGRLPPCLMHCGTDDPFLDDTSLMSVKYMAAGGECIVRIYPGAPHAFTVLRPGTLESVARARAVTKEFVLDKLAASQARSRL